MLKIAFNHIKSLVVIGSVSPRWRSQGTRRARFILHVYLLFNHVSFINTFKHIKDALYVILWFLYCLGFLSIEQILFVIYLSFPIILKDVFAVAGRVCGRGQGSTKLTSLRRRGLFTILPALDSKVCTVYYSTAVYSTILYYRGFIFCLTPPPPGAKIWPNELLVEKKFPLFTILQNKGFQFFACGTHPLIIINFIGEKIWIKSGGGAKCMNLK
jgi:hypothetical protein